MLRKAAMAFGAVLTLVGLLGFVPALTPDGNLLGIFQVDTMHNIVHLLSGLAALAASTRADWSRLYFQVFGVVYAVVTVVGLLQGDTVLGLFTINMADNLLHVLIAAAALYLGFVYRDSEAPTTTAV